MINSENHIFDTLSDTLDRVEEKHPEIANIGLEDDFRRDFEFGGLSYGEVRRGVTKLSGRNKKHLTIIITRFGFEDGPLMGRYELVSYVS